LKKKQQHIENEIRDYISNNLQVIDPSLKLIEIEYYLKNSSASSGFIDILAQDDYNQFVVIEIKRSNSASRSASNEILKYLSLLKRNYGINDSDVRFILISTVWDELIEPFSELFFQSKISIEGYHIDWKDNKVEAIRKVEPRKKVNTRSFSPVQMVYLYKHQNETFEKGVESLKNNISGIGIKNYVIVHLHNDKTTNHRIIYPHALYFAFLRLSVSEYFHLLSNEAKEDIFNYIKENKNEDDFQNLYMNYIENHLISNITTIRDTAEYAYPEKFDRMIVDNWKVVDIIKSGVIANDPRDNIKLLLDIVNEVRGKKGTNSGKYRNSAKTTHRSRFKEIKNNVKNCLSNNDAWSSVVNDILKYFEDNEHEQEITINIYNPPSILFSIYQYIAKKDKDYMPIYNISIINNVDKTLEIFTGQIGWSGQVSNFGTLFQELTTNDSFALNFALTGDYLRDEILNTFGLKFETFYNKNQLKKNFIELVNTELTDDWNRDFGPIIFSSGYIKNIEPINYDLDYFIECNKQILSVITELINQRTTLTF